MMAERLYVELITKQDCPLCESGAKTLKRATSKLGIAVREIDIFDDDDIYDEYSTRVPVVRAPNGSVIDEGKLSQAKLTPALLRLKVSG
jgi:glutaredoxin